VVVTQAVGEKTAIDHRNGLAASRIDDWKNAQKVGVTLMADSSHGNKPTMRCDVGCVATPAIVIDASTAPVLSVMASFATKAATSRGH
jgi:hypothetical protein